MTVYTKATPGVPTSGKYSFGDVIRDSLGVFWQCVQTGIPGKFLASPPYFAPGGTTALRGSVPAAVASQVVATEFASSTGIYHTRLTLTNLAQAVVNGTEFQGTQIYDFPEGRILVQGCVFTLAQKTTSAIASTLNSATGALALGTVVASNVSLTSTMVDLAPSTAFTSSTVIDVAGTAVSGVLAAAAVFDGTTTAKDMFLNSAYATTTDVDADATQTFTGVIDISWIMIGDK